MKIILNSSQITAAYAPFVEQNQLLFYVVDILSPTHVTDVIFVSVAAASSVWFTHSNVVTVDDITNIFDLYAGSPYDTPPIQITYVI